MTATITGADLFCGAGGTSTGLLAAANELGLQVQLMALNHWQVAITTHEQNYPGVKHLWADIEGINPRDVVPSGHLRILVASPECIFFSRARGGKPINDQRRSSASYVLEWARCIDIDDLLIENVREFQDWGPLYSEDHPDKHLRNRPIPERKGEFFKQFVTDLQELGYTVEHRVLCAADYGDATTRERLFIRARKHGAITWPKPTHSRENWRPAREIIDWTVSGKSIYGRKHPLCPATMRRIMAGLRKYSGLQPYIVEYHGDHPGTKSGERRQRSLNEPLATQDTSNRFGLVQPFLTKLYGGLDDACSIDEPMGTITANFEHYGLAEPYLVNVAHSSAGIDERTYPLDEPLHTITSKGQFGIVHPYLTKYYGTGGAVSVDEPLDTITTIDRFGVSEPQLVETSHAAHLLKALKDPNPLYRPQIVEIDGVTYLVDILYRMLLPSELAAAMSFPADYFFSGTQGDQVKQIGNSVPVKLAKALCKSILGVESYGPPVLHHQRTAPSLPNQQAV